MRAFDPTDLDRLLQEHRRGRLDRRRFLQALGSGGVVLAGSAALAACGPPVPTPAPEERPKPAAAAPITAGGATPAAANKPAEAAKPAAALPVGGEDSLVLVFATDVTSMDPHQNVLREGIKLFYHLYDNLGVRNYGSNKIAPWLATSWKSEHVEWEELSRTRRSEGGVLRKYYPLSEAGRAEYEACWRAKAT